MLDTMNRYRQCAFRWAFLLPFVLMGETSRPAWAADKKPVLLDILLPADAELEVNGHKTKSTGETRQFQSPPVTSGRTYAYALKVVWHGNTLTRRIELQPGNPITLDLRTELQTPAEPKPVGSFALLVPPALMLGADAKVVFPLRVKRFHFSDEVTITFENLPKGITVPKVTLSQDQSEGHAILSADTDAAHGTHEINVVAASGSTKDASTIEITVAKPESKPERAPRTPSKTKPETKPAKVSAAEPVLQLVLPSVVDVKVGQKQLVEMQVKTQDGSPLPAEPHVVLAETPDAQVRSVSSTASGFRIGQPIYNAGFTLHAKPDAAAGEYAMRVTGLAGHSQVKGILKVRVKAVPPMPGTASKTDLLLHVVPPQQPWLQPGRSKYVEVKVTAEGDSPLPTEPVVTLVASPESKLTSEVWTIFDFKNSPAAYKVGFAVKAASDAPEGERKVTVLSTAGTAKAEQAFKFPIRAAKHKFKPVRPAPVLQLVLPDGVELPARRTKYIEVQVKTADDSPLPAEPSVTLKAEPDARLRAVPWTFAFKPGQTACTIGLAVTAEAGCSAGNYEAHLHVVDGSSTAERTLKVTVKPSSVRPARP